MPLLQPAQTCSPTESMPCSPVLLSFCPHCLALPLVSSELPAGGREEGDGSEKLLLLAPSIAFPLLSILTFSLASKASFLVIHLHTPSSSLA